MKCCGHERPGKFCSECGKPLSDDPLLRLLSHCHTQVKKQETQAASSEKKSQVSNKDWYRKDAERAAASAKEWQERADALAEILKRRAGDQS